MEDFSILNKLRVPGSPVLKENFFQSASRKGEKRINTMGSKLPAHSPPGYPLVDDLTAENKALWSNEFISNWMNAEIERGPNICRNEKPSTKLTHFFDGTVTPFNVGQAGVDIGPWEGFPGKVSCEYGHL